MRGFKDELNKIIDVESKLSNMTALLRVLEVLAIIVRQPNGKKQARCAKNT